MNQIEFDSFLRSSDVTATRLDAPNQWFVRVGGSGAFGISVRRSQRFYQLSDGLYYSWWQLTLEPPACFTPDQYSLLAEDPQVAAIVAQAKG
jgi:hypothetical protein